MSEDLQKRLRDEFQREVIDRIREMAESRILEQIGDWWEEFLTVNVRQNIASFSDARLTELDGYVQAEKARRSQ